MGSAPVSTDDQPLDIPSDALTTAGCDRLLTDTMRGATADRPGRREALPTARPGDTLVVRRRDRLGRSLRHLLATVTDLARRGSGVRTRTEAIDTTSSGGTLVFHIFGALAAFERHLIRERTRAGLTAARARSHRRAAEGQSVRRPEAVRPGPPAPRRGPDAGGHHRPDVQAFPGDVLPLCRRRR